MSKLQKGPQTSKSKAKTPLKRVKPFLPGIGVDPKTLVKPERAIARTSLFDASGNLRAAITPATARAWRTELAVKGTRENRKHLLRMWLAEYTTSGLKEPQQGLAIINRLVDDLPRKSQLRGQVLADKGLIEMLCGMYAKSAETFDRLVNSKIGGYDFVLVAQQRRHASICAGYHAVRAEAGITEPAHIDPLCGAASLAVILRELNLPHSKPLVSKKTPHTGFGSSLEDIWKGAEDFGLYARAFHMPVDSIRRVFEVNGGVPVVTRVEHDHFIAVYGADENGVTYMCSDCGDWPGGRRQVTWKQWHMMEPDAYLAVAPKDSPFARAFATIPDEGEKDAYESGMFAAARMSALDSEIRNIRTTLKAIQSGPMSPVGSRSVVCGVMPWSFHGTCDCGDSSVGFSTSETKDPINIANGAEEYTAPGGLSVYNPTGPDVFWTHSYASLARTTPNGWGSGWYHPYLTTVLLHEDYSGQTDPSASIEMPNTARIAVDLSGHTSAPSTGQAYTGNVQSGYPYMFKYKNDSGSLKIEVTTTSRTVYEFRKKTTINAYDSLWYLDRITDRMGNHIRLEWTPITFPVYNFLTGSFTTQALTTIKDSSGSALLSLTYDTNARLVEVEDRYDRHVYYTVDTFSGTKVSMYQDVDELVAVSTIGVGSGSTVTRFEYGYLNVQTEPTAAVPFLNEISTISPTGTGMSTATIEYADAGYATGLTDANGNHIEVAYTYLGTGSGRVTVVYTDSSSGEVGRFTVAIAANMNWTDVWDASDDVTYTSGQSFTPGVYVDYPAVSREFTSGSPFKPSAVTRNYDQPAQHAPPAGPPLPTHRTWQYTWNSLSQMTSSTTPKGTVTTYSRDYAAFPLGKITEIGTYGQISTLFDFNDATGLLEEVQSPIPGETLATYTGRQSTTFTYNGFGDVESIVAPGNNAGSTKTVSLDFGGSPKKRQPLTVTDPNGHDTDFTYTARGRVETVTDAIGNTSSATYNAADQLVTSELPVTGNTGTGHAISENEYLYMGGPLTNVNAYDESAILVRSATYAHGHEGELLSVTGDTQPIYMTYDGMYRAKTVSDGVSGHITSYAYDADGNLLEVAYPGSSSGPADKIQYTSFDRQGNVLEKLDGLQHQAEYTYDDEDGLLTAIEYTDLSTTAADLSSNNISLAYDDYGRPTSITDGEGSGTSGYDDLGLVTEASRTYTGLSAKTFTYSYYPDGSRDTLSTPAGDWEYLYDIGGRTTSLVSPAGTHTIQYQDNDWISKRTLPNGTYTDYAYNEVGLPESVTNKSSGGTTQTSFGSFSYDGVFNMLGMTATYAGTASNFGGDTDWTYDSKDRLTNETSTRYSGWNHTNAFDGASNPTTFKGNTRTYNADNQLTTGSMTYDGNGNPTTYKGESWTYDVENRVTAIGTRLTCGYRADNLRAWKQGSTGGKTYFLYDGGTPIIEMDGSGNVANINVFAPDGLVARKEGSTWTYYTFDQQGNVAQRLNASQVVQTSRVFDAWGDGAETTLPRSYDCWNYNGKWGYYYDRETGLYYCQNRMYDSSTGRWINRDPIGYAGGINLYGYCGGGPVGSSDARGTEKITFFYALVTNIGETLSKWGITWYPETRYAKSELRKKGLKMIVFGGSTDRKAVREGVEYTCEEFVPGPENRVKWAGRHSPDDYEVPSGEANLRSIVESLDPTVLGAAKTVGKDILPAIVGPYVAGAQEARMRSFYRWVEEDNIKVPITDWEPYERARLSQITTN